MAKPVETVSEREQRKKRELGFSENKRLRLHKEKRRLRRHNLKPRLSFAEDAEGWQLTIPTSPSKLRWLGGSTSALIVLLAAAYWWSKQESPVMGMIGVALPLLCVAYLFYASLAGALREGLVRFHVARDGGFSVRSRFYFLHRGTKDKCTVGINYSRDDALALLWLPGGKVMRELGDRDLEIIRAFCDTAGVPIASEIAKWANTRAEDSDADGFDDHDDYVRKKWGNRVIVIVGLAFLVSVAWQAISWLRSPTHDGGRDSANGAPLQ